MALPPLLENKHYGSASVFLPENLLREARRQKELIPNGMPERCVLDPDGDLTDHLLRRGLATAIPEWPCYHSRAYAVREPGRTDIWAILPRVVGAAYAVLVAEQLFVSGCRTLVSIASAGMLDARTADAPFVLITEAVRDEGTSYHYLPPDAPASLSGELLALLMDHPHPLWRPGTSWTTDAPYRETAEAIRAMRERGHACVEMEAAGLYAFARARGRRVACFAHRTNTMARQEGDFEKGEEGGSRLALDLLHQLPWWNP